MGIWVNYMQTKNIKICKLIKGESNLNPENMKTPLEILKEYNLSEKDVVFIKEPKENKVWVIHDTKNKRRLVLKAVKRTILLSNSASSSII